MVIVRSPYKSSPVPDTPVTEYMFERMLKEKDRIALIDGETGQQYRCGYVLDQCRRVCTGLRRLGVQPGDMISVFSPNSPELLFVILGSMAAGAVVNTINSNFKPGELRWQIDDVKPKFLYAASSLIDIATAVCSNDPNVKRLISSSDSKGCLSYKTLTNKRGDDVPKLDYIKTQEDSCLVLYSSGTTGLPKGTLLTHRNVLAYPSCMGGQRGSGDVELITLPMYHVYGLVCVAFNAFFNRKTLVMLPRFEAGAFFAAIEKYKVSSLPIVPPIVVTMAKSPLVVNYDLTSVKYVFSGAAPLGRDTEQAFHQRFPHCKILQGYGLTETGGSGTLMPMEGPDKPGSCGYVIPETQVKIIDTENGAELDEGERGEVCIRGPSVMKGYLNNREATQGCIDKYGWCYTGDIGYHEDGFIFVVDRLKELIKYKASQVAPAELEALLLTHEAVADAAVVGVPDEEAGELPKAFIVLKHNTTQENIQQFVAERVAHFKQLRGGVQFLQEIPKSPSGKILRRELLKTISSKSKL